MAVKEGWRGRFFEDFEVGDVYEHPLGRTVTTTDNAWFTLLTQNTAPIHFDHHLSAQTEFGKPLVDSTFTAALVRGQSVTDVSQNVFANLGWDRDPPARACLRGRHDLLPVRGPGEAGVQVARERRHRHREDLRLQPGRHRCHHLQAHGVGLQEGACSRHAPSEPQRPGRGESMNENTATRHSTKALAAFLDVRRFEDMPDDE